MQLYHVETLETVNQSCLKAFLKVFDGKVACDMIAFAVLLINLIAGKEKFIGNLGELCAETLLLLSCNT